MGVTELEWCARWAARQLNRFGISVEVGDMVSEGWIFIQGAKPYDPCQSKLKTYNTVVLIRKFHNLIRNELRRKMVLLEEITVPAKGEIDPIDLYDLEKRMRPFASLVLRELLSPSGRNDETEARVRARRNHVHRRDHVDSQEAYVIAQVLASTKAEVYQAIKEIKSLLKGAGYEDCTERQEVIPFECKTGSGKKHGGNGHQGATGKV